ncbi:hypothetical protein [Burkholderia cepacia]|uniref:hypothetical protein n=1 Tax=Burkholderia cepacia TaxID=292 RepID=UPI002018BE00|nr:hypothetical protein [Burkholderia cepacia]UQO37099.1 hypothetical protein L0Z22_31155 [Burkholderia cepacia]UQO51426.1 hypothetical protein L0Z05_37285 [Burkholderia cepacia]UQP05584.1 hypothetical protein L0Z01_14095 [Burkholderia cepacia]
MKTLPLREPGRPGNAPRAAFPGIPRGAFRRDGCVVRHRVPGRIQMEIHAKARNF